MQESKFVSYDQLPLFLNAKLVAQTLGIGQASAYELMGEKGFPAIRIGSRIVVPKDKFRQWVERQTGGEK
ncbi:helix-turn-helix domain-containing protein [Intestinimonas butyriciproducens]|uniref:helix-turn-helix domain-containing protein n=1 Tax=Intestinimonas butyriciproducens TaxID=1297617 RepID=UPI00189D4E74|nr:helix-turn-helix domain-containing protein [Intestinimonas butyriciproducens]